MLPRPLVSLSPHDRSLAARTAATALLLSAAAALLMARTDEAGSGWPDRLARLGAMSPALGAIAAAIQTQQARRRGELMALALVGASPLRQSLGAALGGALAGLVLAAVALPSAPSLRALFPVATGPSWVPSGQGFAAPSLGLALARPGGPVLFGAQAAHPGELAGRAALTLAIGVGAVVAPWWAAVPCPAGQRALLSGAALLGAVGCFHAVAQGAPVLSPLLPSSLLAAHLLWRHRRGAPG